ncbi:hypothetical protein DYB34_010100 [Aphanomyces astaci]|uniref:Uncharacterized protein n=1 Tax=Aphanomyces astaci TaxID=112090 RepID=A0A418BHE0_APHAT|nr:hypothetical protein DYB34_010100 [Aphanomyces astaci]
MAFSQAMVDKRVTLNTKKENNSNWSKVVSWRQDNPEYAHDPRLTRFARLPEAICCYVGQLMLPDDAGNSPSMNVANKARAGISEFYKYNNDGYGTSSWCVKDGQGYGNPMTSPVVLGCFKGLQKEKKATQVTRRAAPMTKPMPKTLYAFLDHSNDTSKSFNLKDFSLAKSTTSQQDPNVRLEYHEYTFHDRKTESGNDRTYRLHHCQELWDSDICAKHHFDTWIEHVETAMKHNFNEDLVFPQIPLSRKYSNLSASVFNWGHAMSEGSVINILNEVIATMLRDIDFCSTAHGAVLKCFENVYITTHTFRRGFAQWMFLHEDKDKRWSLKMLKWWGGWSEQDKCDVIMKYLLDSIYVAEEEVLADATSPDRKHLAGCPTTWIYSTHEQLSELVELVAPNEDGEQLAMANCCTLGKAQYAIAEFLGIRMQDIDNTKYEEIVTAHEAVMMLYGLQSLLFW